MCIFLLAAGLSLLPNGAYHIEPKGDQNPAGDDRSRGARIGPVVLYVVQLSRMSSLHINYENILLTLCQIDLSIFSPSATLLVKGLLRSSIPLRCSLPSSVSRAWPGLSASITLLVSDLLKEKPQ